MLACLLLAAVGCETVTEPAPVAAPAAPTLSDFSFAPDTVQFEALPPEQVAEDTLAKIPLELTVHASDANGCVQRVGYIIKAAFGSSDPQASGQLQWVGEGADPPGETCRNGSYAKTDTLLLPQGAVGLYTVRLYAVDNDSLLGDQVQGLFYFTAAKREPPVIHRVEAPDSVKRPEDDETVLVPIVAVVSDPNGLENVGQVEMLQNNAQSFSPQIFLCDDGGVGGCGPFSNSGDKQAGDGRFTITTRVDSSNQAGSNTFKFQATDRSGLTSSIVEKTIVVE